MPRRKKNPGIGTWLLIVAGTVVAAAAAVGIVRKKSKSKAITHDPDVDKREVVEDVETFLRGRSVKYEIAKSGSQYYYSVRHNPYPGEGYSYSFGATGFAESRDEAFYKIIGSIPFPSFLPEDRSPDSAYVQVGSTQMVLVPRDHGSTHELSYDSAHLDVGLSDDPEYGKVAMVKPLSLGIYPIEITSVYHDGTRVVYRVNVAGIDT